MRRWAQAVIDDLGLRGDETVLDAGCGSGSVTFDLLERLPRGRIYAVDSSPDMISKITQGIEERGITNVIPLEASLTDFELPEQVDVVFSNAVLHWIPDDDALFGCLFRAAKPGGRFRAQCGGGQNIARLMAATESVEMRKPYERYLRLAEFRKQRTAEEAKDAMERAGWTDVRASLFDSPVRFDNHDDAALYLRTIILQRHVAAFPRSTRSRSSAPSSTRPSAASANPSPPTTSASISGRAVRIDPRCPIRVPSPSPAARSPSRASSIFQRPHPHPASSSVIPIRSTAVTCTTTSSTRYVRWRSRTGSSRCASTSAAPAAARAGTTRAWASGMTFVPRSPCSAICPEVDSERVALAGYSFGAAVAVQVASDPDLRAFVGVSLPTMMPLDGVTLACPALFVSGDEDEYSDADDLTEFVTNLGSQADLKLLSGLGHFWFGVEPDLKAIVAPFLQAHLLGIATA